jgi:mRNA interferase MazF
MNIKRWEIWLADLDPNFGTESGKKRPVLIIQSDLLNQVHFSTAVLPITSKIIPNAKLLRFSLQNLNTETGLTLPSEVLLDQIRTIDNKRFIKKLGEIQTRLAQEKIEEQLKIMLDL